MELTAISLFSGIGGDTLAAQWAGFRTLCFVEWDLYCQAVLRKNFPGIPVFGDIDEFDAKRYRGHVTLVHGGDPCQPNSVAGQRKGAEDDRYKWPSMLRVIRDCRPAWVVNENPTGRLTMDFHQVLSDLEGEGYETRSFVIPTCAVNAPHRRDRLYIVAYSDEFRGRGRSDGNQGRCERTLQTQGRDSDAPDSRLFGQEKSEQQTAGIEQCNKITSHDDDRRLARSSIPVSERRPGQKDGDAGGDGADVADTERKGLEGTITEREVSTGGLSPEYYPVSGWQGNPLEVAAYLCRVDDGFSSRVDRLKALGNAQVPQQVYPLFKGIADIERMSK